ncbi:hypothetical protein KGF54_003677 [Candida jiufengensis]|uniref:uncharacterized protein n=1 Tax=Candida jiufengensis TaxID=497108 RepID=UPI002225634D|nr:uncharacterized protein KGF54_003677 [Candida jiufengensis]KAI5952810.1 hypothetical protein KGF54_003677 [Candida jiufengensis]
MSSENSKPQEKPTASTESNSTTEPKTYVEETNELLKKDELDKQDLNKIEDIAKNILNPNNENPQMNEYINSTMSYIGDVIQKMQNTNDKDATAKEIADDLTKRFENWANNKKKEIEEQKKNSTETSSSTTDEKSSVSTDDKSSSTIEKK